ncbi:MAG: 30S ribosomal protein S4 [Spirochaetales bacterium]
MRYTGPMWKVSRRLKYSLLETGEELEKRPFAPGQHGKDSKKLSEYGKQLQEKQKVKFQYGLTEKQLKLVFGKAKKQKGNIGETFLTMLEMRLDNLVYRSGFAATRRQARQLVSHGHILINKKSVNIPSYLVSVGDILELSDSAKNFALVKDNLSANFIVPAYLTLNKDNFTSELTRKPKREEFLQQIEESLIVEYYNK